jgi:hypothetical protein
MAVRIYNALPDTLKEISNDIGWLKPIRINGNEIKLKLKLKFEEV